VNELEIISYPQIEGLSIFFDTVDYRTPHIHPAWELLWILDHPLAVTCGGERYVVSKDEMILFHPNEPHEFHKMNESVTFLCLQISPSMLQGAEGIFVEHRLVHHYAGSAIMKKLMVQMQEIIAAYLSQREQSALLCIGNSCLLFYELFSVLPSRRLTPEETEKMDQQGARLRRLLHFVDENFMHKVRLSDFAEEEGCSMSYLSRFVKQSLNQTFQDYVTSVRFNYACKLIEAGEGRMLDICVASGFSDYRYFCREFRRQCGMTPEEYSRNTDRQREMPQLLHRSTHSVERFYSREESLKLYSKYFLLN